MATFDQGRDGLHVSVSQLKMYLRCPRSFELRYVAGEAPAFKPVPFAFGTSFHAALARFYLDLKVTGAPPPVTVLMDSFRDTWQREVDGDVPLQPDEDGDDDTAALVDKGAEMLSVFHAAALKSLDGITVESVEQPFSVPLVDPDAGVELEEKLVGVFDLVVRKKRQVKVLEHKSSARRFTDDQLRWDLQPTAYMLGAKAMGFGDARVTFQIITKARMPQVQIVDVERDAADLVEFQRVAVNVLRGVDAGAFPPVRSWACRSCPYAHACRPHSTASCARA